MRQLAEHAARNNSWSGLTQVEFEAFIGALYSGAEISTVLDVGPAIRVPFVLCAHLLVTWRQAGEQAQD